MTTPTSDWSPRYHRDQTVKIKFTGDIKTVAHIQRANCGIGRGYDYMMTDGTRWTENELDMAVMPDVES